LTPHTSVVDVNIYALSQNLYRAETPYIVREDCTRVWFAILMYNAPSRFDYKRFCLQITSASTKIARNKHTNIYCFMIDYKITLF
jgi:hypothetical protein